ncbi:MAG: shikimate kinase [Treponema sp.]|jgi:shikimate kinase|nr:shikimate kinase [Treponema sp.]
MHSLANPRSILLTGPKHAGKTSTGRVLARYWGIDCIDLDELIERKTGSSPRNLYTQSPERFRQAETEALKSLIPLKAPPGPIRVIAAGGGIIDNADAMALVKQADLVVIYLEVSADTAWKRICKTKPLPPFLNTDNPQETHKALHQRRAAAYKTCAHIGIQAEAKGAEQIATEIIRALRLFPERMP